MEPSSFSDDDRSPRNSSSFYGTLKVHYSHHKNLLLDLILSQINPAHILIPYFNDNYNFILPSMPRFPQ
jgi:hypothetical protein